MSEIKLILGDCLEKMKDIPNSSIDLVITSPPYYEKNIRGHNKKSSPLYMNFFIPFIKYKTEWFKEIYRIIKEKGMVFMNLGFNADTGWKLPFELIANNPFNTRDLIIWHKRNPEPNSMGGLTHSYEFIFIFHKTTKPNYTIKKNEYIQDVWDMKVEQNYSCTKSSEFYHGAMFPLSLPKKILQIASNKGDTILDCFMGSGTTGIACKELGRNFIGIEINPKYIEIAQRRINQTIESFL